MDMTPNQSTVFVIFGGANVNGTLTFCPLAARPSLELARQELERLSNVAAFSLFLNRLSVYELDLAADATYVFHTMRASITRDL